MHSLHQHRQHFEDPVVCCVCAAETAPRNEFSDVYNEVGPDNVGGMGDEPSCTITLHMLREAAQQGTHGSDAPGTQGTTCADNSGAAEEDALPEAASSSAHHGVIAQPDDTATECLAQQHGDQQSLYVAVHQLECDPHKVVALRPGQHQQMLLGLSNDVDCAAVAFSCSDKLALDAQHCHSIPALAYVAAGQL